MPLSDLQSFQNNTSTKIFSWGQALPPLCKSFCDAMLMSLSKKVDMGHAWKEFIMYLVMIMKIFIGKEGREEGRKEGRKIKK